MAKPKAGTAPVVNIRFVSPGEAARPTPLREDQKHFPQSGLTLEYWGTALFGYERATYRDRETGKEVNKPKSAADAAITDITTWREYHKAMDISDMTFWKKLYIRTFEVLQASIFKSIGSIDKSHRKAIEDELTRALDRLKSAKGKDAIHAQLIASLFRLVFLLLGRPAYAVPGKRRNLATFGTLSYSQTEEQLSWLVKGYIYTSLARHGFDNSIDADLAYRQWSRDNKASMDDPATFLAWESDRFPNTYNLFV